MRVVCTESTIQLVHIGERLDSLMVKLEGTLEFQSIPIHAYIDKVQHLHDGGTILCAGILAFDSFLKVGW